MTSAADRLRSLRAELAALGVQPNPATINPANEQLSRRVVQGNLGSATGTRIATPERALGTQLPFGSYTITLRTVLPKLDNKALASEYSCRARIGWGAGAAEDFCEVDCFPFAAVPFIGNGFTVSLGNDQPSAASGGHGRSVFNEETVLINVSPGVQRWQASRTFLVPSPLAANTTVNQVRPPYATHVRWWGNVVGAGGYSANTALTQFDMTGTQLDTVTGAQMIVLNREGGWRLAQDCMWVRLVDAVNNLAGGIFNFTIAGAAGRS